MKSPKKLTKKIRSRSWCFTWNNYPKGSSDTLVTTFSEKKLYYVFQEEICPSTGTPHLQGVIKFPNPVFTSFQNEFNKKIHWERCRSWPKSKLYCCKLDSRSGDVFTNVQGLVIKKPPKDPFDINIATDWQKNVLSLIKSEPDFRTINWYWESDGNVGKSCLTRHILLTNRNSALCVGGSSRDILYGVMNFVKDEKNDFKILLIDIPRSSFDNVSYKAIEQIKNGYFYNCKYESEMVIFDPPHVIVFCNFPPNENNLSVDRWNIVDITNLNSFS